MTKIITNTLVQPLSMFYRVGERIIEVDLPARAICHEVSFASDEHFKEFEKQNRLFIDSKKIVIGNIRDREAEKISMDNASGEKQRIKHKKDKVVESFESTASGVNTKMKFEVTGG